MGHLQGWRVDARIAQKNQIEIEGPCGAGEWPLAAVGVLDAEERIEKLASRQRRFANRDGVQV